MKSGAISYTKNDKRKSKKKKKNTYTQENNQNLGNVEPLMLIA